MKYSRLTKEQFEALKQEFVNFLATQSISGEEWKNIKKKSPEVAEQELDIFSDLVWEGALKQAKYLENISPQQLFLFSIGEAEMSLIVVKVTNDSYNITTPGGYSWLQENFASDEVEFFTSSKAFSEDKNTDIFSLIKQGSVITKGELYQFFSEILKK
jgi:cag pathogenicity island protein 24